MKKSDTYPTHVYWDERDQGYIALAPDLPGCSAFGETKAKALEELEQAIEGWIETATLAQEPVPAPSPLPKPNTYSGKMLVRMPASLHEGLAKGAANEGVSLNQHIVVILAKAVGSQSRQLEHKWKKLGTAMPAVVDFGTPAHVTVDSDDFAKVFLDRAAALEAWSEGTAGDKYFGSAKVSRVYLTRCRMIDRAETYSDQIWGNPAFNWKHLKDHQNG